MASESNTAPFSSAEDTQNTLGEGSVHNTEKLASSPPSNPKAPLVSPVASPPARVDNDEQSTPKYLFLIDLNGTLCYRSLKRATGALSPHAKLSGRYVYARPFLRSFMRSLLAIPELQVCITTSITERNAVPMLRSILGTFLSLEDWLLPRELCTKLASSVTSDDKDGSHAQEDVSWKTVRDIASIWEEVNKRGLSFDASNTIVVDGQEHKVIECKENAVLVNEFIPSDCGDATLNYLLNYVSDLVKASPKDVRTYIGKNPFDIDGLTEEGATA